MRCVSLLLLSASIAAHTWLECTDYADPVGLEWDPSKCSGRPRNSAKQVALGFGVEGGNIQSNSKACQAPYVADDVGVVRATYTPGQTVCLAYPAKSHVSYGPDKYSPDTGTSIRRSKRGDVTTAAFDGRTYEHLNGKHVDGQVDFKGFQHCLGFTDSNKDKALCTMCFSLERDIAPGDYAFIWTWEQNPGSFYTTCWDATVVLDQAVDVSLPPESRPPRVPTTVATTLSYVPVAKTAPKLTPIVADKSTETFLQPTSMTNPLPTPVPSTAKATAHATTSTPASSTLTPTTKKPLDDEDSTAEVCAAAQVIVDRLC